MKTTNTNFLYKLSSIRHLSFTFLERELSRAGVEDLPPSYGDILYIIHSQGVSYVKEIVDRSYKDKSTVSNSINHLVKNGYVEKIPDPEDGRRVRIKLTKRSEKYIDAMAEISRKLKTKLFRSMSGEEQEILFLLLNKVEKNLRI